MLYITDTRKDWSGKTHEITYREVETVDGYDNTCHKLRVEIDGHYFDELMGSFRYEITPGEIREAKKRVLGFLMGYGALGDYRRIPTMEMPA